MKKQVLLSVFTLVCLMSVSMPISAQKAKGIHPWNVSENNRGNISTEEANWSLFLHGGFNVFDGDFASEMKHSVMAPTLGLGVDYRFNPTWGLSLDYTFRQVGVAGDTKNGADNADELLRGFEHQAMAYLNFDIFNIFFPKAATKLFALNIFGGGGAMFWRNTIQYTTGRWTKMQNINGEQCKIWEGEYNKYNTANRDPEKMDKYRAVGALAAGVSFDFNITRDLALGLRALYTHYVGDDIDGRLLSNKNDGVFDTELLLRWKLEAGKKSHVNNYVTKERTSGITMAQRPSVVQQEVVATSSQTNVVPVAGRTDTIYVYHRDTINLITHDTVEIHHKDTVSMTIYNTRRDTLYIIDGQIVSLSKQDAEQENSFFVYFNSDSYELSDQALFTIQQVADRLLTDPNLCAVIIGYCDNVGNAEYNKRLGQNRSQSVYDELNLEYGVDAERMFAISRGIIVGGRSNSQYAPNRRTEIRIVDASFFNTLRNQYRADIESQKEAMKHRTTK